MEKKFVTLTFKGTQLDSSIEHELFPTEDDKYGFIAYVEYQNGQVQVFHNLTEVHWRFKSGFSDPQVAFESDIHSIGCTRTIDMLRSVIIQQAPAKNRNF